MKMREEIDALKVMALDPLEVLIIPRLVALVIALPVLTFLADLAQIGGGLLVSWIYAGLTPAVVSDRASRTPLRPRRSWSASSRRRSWRW